MEFIKFELMCLKRAWMDTKAIPPLGIILYHCVILISAASLDVYIRGWSVAMDETATIIIWTVPVIIGAVTLFVFNLLHAPSKIVSDLRKENENQLLDSKNTIKELKRDSDSVLVKKDTSILALNNRVVELQEFIKKSSDYEKPDVSLVEAVYYIAFQKWGIDKVINDDGEYFNEETGSKLFNAIRTARVAALADRLPIWGLESDKQMRAYPVRIESQKDFWTKYWPNDDFFKYNDSQKMGIETFFDAFSEKLIAYEWYYTNINAVEKLWPPENILA